VAGYPHVYRNLQKLKLYKNCLKSGVTLLEYPIYDDKSKLSWQMDVAKSKQKAPPPMRVISTTDHNKFCGVVTHETEDDQGRGTGGFKLCEHTFL